jgi:hypothetical protein
MEYGDTPQPETDDVEKPFTAFGQFGSGHLDLRVFDQTRWWVDINGSAHGIATMSDSYLINVVEHCERHADYYHAAHLRHSTLSLLKVVLSGSPSDALAIALETFERSLTEPIDWIRSTPLLSSLSAELRTRDRQRPDLPEQITARMRPGT